MDDEKPMPTRKPYGLAPYKAEQDKVLKQMKEVALSMRQFQKNGRIQDSLVPFQVEWRHLYFLATRRNLATQHFRQLIDFVGWDCSCLLIAAATFQGGQ